MWTIWSRRSCQVVKNRKVVSVITDSNTNHVQVFIRWALKMYSGASGVHVPMVAPAIHIYILHWFGFNQVSIGRAAFLYMPLHVDTHDSWHFGIYSYPWTVGLYKCTAEAEVWHPLVSILPTAQQPHMHAWPGLLKSYYHSHQKQRNGAVAISKSGKKHPLEAYFGIYCI